MNENGFDRCSEFAPAFCLTAAGVFSDDASSPRSTPPRRSRPRARAHAHCAARLGPAVFRAGPAGFVSSDVADGGALVPAPRARAPARAPESTSIAARPDADAGRCLGVARAGLEPARSRAPSLALDASLRTRLATALAARGEEDLGASRELRVAHPGRRVPPLGGRRRSSPSRGRRPAGGPSGGPADAADLARVSRLVARVERAARGGAAGRRRAAARSAPARARRGGRARGRDELARDAEGLRRWFEAARAALDDDDEKCENGPTAKLLTAETNPESEMSKPNDGRFYSPRGRSEKKETR